MKHFKVIHIFIIHSMLFLHLGMNSIVLYAGHELVKEHFPFSWEPLHHTHAEYLAMDLIGASLWVVIAYWMFYVDFFVKI